MTEKLYYDDSHRKIFKAVVLACTDLNEGFGVILDRTVFFPEGGGQSADTGFLNDVEVFDVREKSGEIIHVTRERIEVGTQVNGKICWTERFSKMQQHSGEHIISGLVHGRFGYNNVGFHLADEYVTLDFDGPMTTEQLREIEAEANLIVAADLEVEVLYPTEKELEDLKYRSKIEIKDQVRLVRIPGVDLCACCAPHVSRTGEIGLVKLVQMQNYKGGVRITMHCGMRALADYNQKEDSVKAISMLLSAKENAVADAVGRMKAELASLKADKNSLLRELMRIKVENMHVTPDIAVVFEHNLDGDMIREMMNLLLDKGNRTAAVFSCTTEGQYQFVIGSRDMDVRGLSAVMKEKLNGRGGGKPEMVQGSVQAAEEAIRQVLAENL